MKEHLLEMLRSKKFKALVISLVALFVVALLKGLGIGGLTEVSVEKLLDIFYQWVMPAYLLGQGIADHGKPAAELNVKSADRSAEILMALAAKESKEEVVLE